MWGQPSPAVPGPQARSGFQVVLHKKIKSKSSCARPTAGDGCSHMLIVSFPSFAVQTKNGRADPLPFFQFWLEPLLAAVYSLAQLCAS